MAAKKGKKTEDNVVKANTGQFNQDLVDRLNKIRNWENQRKTLNENIRFEVADIKKVYNIPGYATRYEMKMRAMDPETRTEIERNVDIIRSATGVQQSFEFIEDNRKKKGSVGADPVEASQSLSSATH